MYTLRTQEDEVLPDTYAEEDLIDEPHAQGYVQVLRSEVSDLTFEAERLDRDETRVS